MRIEDMSPQLRFLSDAAHLLSQSAPETSAFLIHRRNQMLVANDQPVPDAHRQHACSACGHILIPGQGDTLSIRADNKSAPPSNKAHKTALRRRQPSKQPGPAPPARTRAMPTGVSKVLECGKCAKRTVLMLEGPGRISRSQRVAQQTKGAQEKRPQTAAEPVKSANASSKKRAKNRKAGLQALLDQKQGLASSSGFGLSLSDFMKK